MKKTSDKKIINEIGSLLTNFAVEIGFKANKNSYNKKHSKYLKLIRRKIWIF